MRLLLIGCVLLILSGCCSSGGCGPGGCQRVVRSVIKHSVRQCGPNGCYNPYTQPSFQSQPSYGAWTQPVSSQPYCPPPQPMNWCPQPDPYYSQVICEPVYSGVWIDVPPGGWPSEEQPRPKPKKSKLRQPNPIVTESDPFPQEDQVRVPNPKVKERPVVYLDEFNNFIKTQNENTEQQNKNFLLYQSQIEELKTEVADLKSKCKSCDFMSEDIAELKNQYASLNSQFSQLIAELRFQNARPELPNTSAEDVADLKSQMTFILDELKQIRQEQKTLTNAPEDRTSPQGPLFFEVEESP